MAPRRLGKSGLIHHAFARINKLEPDAVCIYVDLLDTKTRRDFVMVLTRQVILALDTDWQKALRQAKRFFKSVRPTLTIDEPSGMPTLSLDVLPAQETATLEQTFDYIVRSGRRCYIALDEFQQITQYPEQGLEALLRSYVQQVPNAWFIFAGSQQHLLSEMFLSAKRPFYLASQIMTIAEIPEDTYREWANGFFARQHRSFSQDDFHELYSLVDGQTWYIQEVLHQLWETPDSPLDAGDVHRVLNVIVGRFAIGFSQIYSGLTPNQALMLRAISRQGQVREPFAQAFINQYRLPALSSSRQALNALVRQQLVYKSVQGVYQVYDRFFSLWLQRLPI